MRENVGFKLIRPYAERGSHNRPRVSQKFKDVFRGLVDPKSSRFLIEDFLLESGRYSLKSQIAFLVVTEIVQNSLVEPHLAKTR